MSPPKKTSENTSKIHRPVAEQVLLALQQIFNEGSDDKTSHTSRQADRVIEKLFKSNRQLGSRDRRFIAESVYDIVRWWRLLAASIGRDEITLGSTELWRIFGAWLLLRGDALPDWPEFQGLNLAEIAERKSKIPVASAIGQSFPDWLYELGERELGREKWAAYAQKLNEPAPVVLRANRLKIDAQTLIGKLKKEDIETTLANGTTDGLILTERKNVSATESFATGLFEIQDGASQQIAPLLNVEPSHSPTPLNVIDACAGAGGKTLHLAALMGNRGTITALDVNARKLEELEKRRTRAGAKIVNVKKILSSHTMEEFKGRADRLLLDVPCSGLGVLRRNADTKWRLKPADIARLHDLQATILNEYTETLKVGGRLVYATCSILPSENEKQIEAFMKRQPETWRLEKEIKFAPGENGYDGFYAAALTKLK